MFVDADAHVQECEDSWEFLPKEYRDLVPHTIAFSPEDAPAWLGGARSSGSGHYRFWFIDGQLFQRHFRSDERTRTTVETRELYDVPKRLRDMDALGIEVQAIYPSLFLNEVSQRQELTAALYYSYNRWLAERCSDSNGRLRWVAMIPFALPEQGRKEIEFAKEHGACGVFKRTTEAGRSIGDPLFHPLYKVAEDLSLPICIHQNKEWFPVTDRLASRKQGYQDSGTIPVLVAFATLLDDKIPSLFPDLRFAFVESGASWIPYLLTRCGWDHDAGWSDSGGSGQPLSDLGFYVTCDVHEDLGYLLKAIGGDDNIVVGTDYSHGDRSSVIDAHEAIVARTDIDPKSAIKITNDNARSLYGF